MPSTAPSATVAAPPAAPPASSRVPGSRGLGVTIGAAVVLVELFIFAVVAFWQHAYLDRQLDALFLQRVRTVSALMGRGLLSYESLNSPGQLGPLLGEDPVMTMVLGADGHIFNAMDPALTGKTFSDLPDVDPAWLAEARHGVVIRTVQEHGEHRTICLAPLYTAMDRTPFLYAFIKVRASNGEHQKREMTMLFVYGGGLGVLITSCLLLLVLHRQLFLPIRNTAVALRRLTAGDLHARVEHPVHDNQLGALQNGLNAMAQSLEETVARLINEITQRLEAEEQLRHSNETLEQRVHERTQELEALNALLTREAATRKNAQAALQETNARLQGVLDNSPTAIFMVDLQHRLVLHNARFPELYGLGRSNVQGERLQALFPEDVVAGMVRSQDAVRATGLPLTLEETLPGPDGYSTLLTTTYPMQDAWGQIWAVCAIAMDITAHKRLEAETVRAGQLASIGELAAGVAHEINNPVNGIINFSQLLLDDATPAQRELLTLTIKQAERVAAIVRSLLTYARAEKEPLGPVRMDELIADGLSLIRYHLEKLGGQVTVQVEPDLPLVRGRPRELQQVLLNLLSNSLHALKEKKRLDPAAPLRCCITAMSRGDGRVALTVEDTGPGIAPESLSKVMLPFYTTKPKEQGTGLGLSISRSIVAAHGGTLTLANAPGGGAVAEALLPAWPSPAS